MSQKSDDSIERFFRKAVVQQDKTFMERDWQRMEQMLDAQAISAAALHAGRVKRALKALTLLMIISSVFIIGNETQTQSKNVSMQAAFSRVEQPINVKPVNPTADVNSSSSLIENKPAAISGTKPQDNKTLKAKSPAAFISKNEKRNGVSAKTINNSGSKLFSSNDIQAHANTLPFAKESEAEVENEEISISKPVGEELATNSIGDPQSDNVNADTLTDSFPELVAVKPGPGEKKEQTQETGRPKLIVTGLISPDFSTTSLTKYTRPSGVFGILIGYKISKRFTLLSGVTKSLKKYEGYGNEYSPPEGYWQNRTNGVVPDEVEGKCGIIEVPLMIQFDVIQRLKSRIFFSTGVSSYFMRSENYQYTFNEPNPGAAESWAAKEPTQYLFKIGHLSAGYDRMIGKNFSVGIEPFLKVPFQGIGWTDINLYSTGAYINVRYTILQTHQ